MIQVLGWDLGGANIKLARASGVGVQEVLQIPCPRAARPGKFDDAVGQALALCPAGARHAVTMTGELSDVFADRREGVLYLVALMRRVLDGQPLSIYGGRAGFLAPEQAGNHVVDIASANWHATAAWMAGRVPDGLLIDVGTTTSDLIPLRGGAPAARGYTDAERLTEGELVYTGVVRTPVMAIAATAPFGGRMQRIAAERFAVMADVYRLTGELPEDADPYPAVDERGKSTAESAARLARMLGRDGGDASMAEWTTLAQHFAEAQLGMLEDAALQILARERFMADEPIVGAGCGRFLARRLAERLGRSYIDFAELIDAAPAAREVAARCAPAAALALLAAMSEAATNC